MTETLDARTGGPMRAILDQRHLIMGYINSIVRNLNLAEDLFQESLMIAMKQEFESNQHALAWIRVTARNLAFSELRQRARRPVSLTPETIELLDDDWNALADENGSHGNRLQALRTCCAKLSDASRRLLDLRFKEGLEGTAISERVGRPVNTVYVSLSRIYKRLASCIDQEMRVGHE